jgi:hypothetical protein
MLYLSSSLKYFKLLHEELGSDLIDFQITDFFAIEEILNYRKRYAM